MTTIIARPARLLLALLLAIAALAVVPSTLAAQKESRAARAALLPALPDTTAMAVVILFAQAREPDLILLAERGATSEALDMAAAALRHLRSKYPAPVNDIRMTITGGSPARVRDEEKVKHYRGEFEKLRRAERKPVSGYEAVPWIDIQVK